MHDAKAEDGRREAVVPMRRISRSVRVARGLTFRETMAGYFAWGAHAPTEGARLGRARGERLVMRAVVEIRDVSLFVEDAEHRGSLSGSVRFQRLGAPLGILRLGAVDLLCLLSTLRATNASGLACAGALARFGQLFGGELWDSYIVGDR